MNEGQQLFMPKDCVVPIATHVMLLCYKHKDKFDVRPDQVYRRDDTKWQMLRTRNLDCNSLRIVITLVLLF